MEKLLRVLRKYKEENTINSNKIKDYIDNEIINYGNTPIDVDCIRMIVDSVKKENYGVKITKPMIESIVAYGNITQEAFDLIIKSKEILNLDKNYIPLLKRVIEGNIKINGEKLREIIKSRVLLHNERGIIIGTDHMVKEGIIYNYPRIIDSYYKGKKPDHRYFVEWDNILYVNLIDDEYLYLFLKTYKTVKEIWRWIQ